jgi:imidazoleglycerol-phosphate dehydratase
MLFIPAPSRIWKGARMRTGKITRKTRETNIQASIDIDGKGIYEINTGLGFFNHMLESLCRHGMLDMTLDASGDVHVDYHHLVEDTGIVLGQLIKQALGDKKGITRFGQALIPLDEALAEAIIDISGRPHYESNLSRFTGEIGQFPMELADVFFDGFASMGYTVHLDVRSGKNLHHVVEATFKAFARALRMACEQDPRMAGILPSTKDHIES